MAKVQIIADSCCDLEREQLEKYNIDIVPLYVILGDKSFKDGKEIGPDKIYRYYEQTRQTPKTSAANVDDFVDIFKTHINAGKQIVYIGISSEVSSTVENARRAAELFPESEIFIVDSRNLSTGIGLLVLRACEMVSEGKTAREIAEKITALTEITRTSFVIDTLDFLRSGGRCSMLTAFGASLLSIKPEIAVRDGKMSNRAKYIGEIAAVARKYTKNLLLGIEKIDTRRAFVTYTKGTDREVFDAVYDTVTGTGFFDEVIITAAGCVITSHCGRNAIGFLFLDKE